MMAGAGEDELPDISSLESTPPIEQALTGEDGEFWEDFDDDPDAENKPVDEEDETPYDENEDNPDLMSMMTPDAGEEEENLKDGLSQDEGDFDFGDFEDGTVEEATPEPVNEPAEEAPAETVMPEAEPEPAPAYEPPVLSEPEEEYEPFASKVPEKEEQKPAYEPYESPADRLSASDAQKMMNDLKNQQKELELQQREFALQQRELANELKQENEKMIQETVEKAVEEAVEDKLSEYDLQPEPVVEDPVVEEPVVEEPVVEESVVEDDVAEEALAEEAVIDEPAVEEPVTEETVADEVLIDEPAVDEPLVEESAVEEVAEEASEEEELDDSLLDEDLISSSESEDILSEEAALDGFDEETDIAEEPVIEETDEPVIEETEVEVEPETEPELEIESEAEAEDLASDDFSFNNFLSVEELEDLCGGPYEEEAVEEPEIEASPAEKESDDNFITADDMLEKIGRILNDDNIAKNYAAELELFKKLRVLSNFLPEKNKNSFECCRMRMVIEYIIQKMSGKRGLLITAESLIKSGVLGEEYNRQLEDCCEEELSNDLIRHVISDMKKLAQGLEDKYLCTALCVSADGILEQIALRNQKSEIF